jgi:hypothetical protein
VGSGTASGGINKGTPYHYDTWLLQLSNTFCIGMILSSSVSCNKIDHQNITVQGLKITLFRHNSNSFVTIVTAVLKNILKI